MRLSRNNSLYDRLTGIDSLINMMRGHTDEFHSIGQRQFHWSHTNHTTVCRQQRIVQIHQPSAISGNHRGSKDLMDVSDDNICGSFAQGVQHFLLFLRAEIQHASTYTMLACELVGQAFSISQDSADHGVGQCPLLDGLRDEAEVASTSRTEESDS